MLPDAPPTPDPSIPVPGRVPDGFEASAALRCDWLEFGAIDESGRAVAEVQRFEGDLAPLLAALAEPDDPVPSDLACTADLELVPPLWLESVDGGLIAVHYPRDACGKTKPAVHDALDALEVTSVSRMDGAARPVTGQRVTASWRPGGRAGSAADAGKEPAVIPSRERPRAPTP